MAFYADALQGINIHESIRCGGYVGSADAGREGFALIRRGWGEVRINVVGAFFQPVFHVPGYRPVVVASILFVGIP